METKAEEMAVGYPIDLHLHSTFSDGLLTPAQLCARAGKLGLTAMALCDHDTLDGLEPMEESVREHNRQSPQRPVTFLPAIELSSGPGGRTHILGYGVKPGNQALGEALAISVRDRMDRAARIVDKLAAQGVELTPEARGGLRGPTVGRAHIARALIVSGVVNSVAQAFDRYLAEGRSCYEPRKVMTAGEAVALLKAAGAVPVLAHPLRLKLDEQGICMLVRELRDAGLRGIEAYHPSADRAGAARLESYARRNGLLVTGGSDFHGDREARTKMGRMPAGWTRWPEDRQALLEAVAERSSPAAAPLP